MPKQQWAAVYPFLPVCCTADDEVGKPARRSFVARRHVDINTFSQADDTRGSFSLCVCAFPNQLGACRHLLYWTVYILEAANVKADQQRLRGEPLCYGTELNGRNVKTS